MSLRTAEAIVAGAGIVGLAAARSMAGRGARVMVVEGRRVGAEASGAAAGILAPQGFEPDSPLLPLGLAARDRHLALAAELEEETGIDVELSRLGRIEVAFSDAEEQALEQRRLALGARGLPASRLSPAEVRDAEPNLSPAVRAGLHHAGDRRVDNVRLTRALAASAVARGATLFTGRPVTALLVEGGRVAGVRTAAEELRAPLVINATGAWAGLLPGDPAPPPVEPVRGQIAAFDMAPALLRHVVSCSRGYLVPRADGRTLAGSTHEHVGFDKSVTAGGLRAVLELALEIAPALADVRLADAWAGLRPGTPDGLPVLGAGGLPGLFHAAGLYRDGVLLGPLAGELVAALALGEAPVRDLTPFAPSRFTASQGR